MLAECRVLCVSWGSIVCVPGIFLIARALNCFVKCDVCLFCLKRAHRGRFRKLKLASRHVGAPGAYARTCTGLFASHISPAFTSHPLHIIPGA